MKVLEKRHFCAFPQLTGPLAAVDVKRKKILAK